MVRFEDLEPFAWFGWTGVETFFVISGFVICASAKRSTPYQFLRGRVCRLYPAAWICATVTAAVSLGIGLSPATQIVEAYLRSIAIYPSGPWIDSVYRTLIVEEIFYLLVLILLVVRGFRDIEAFAILLGAYSLAFWIFGACVDLRDMAPAAILNFSKYGIFFSLGMMIWMARDRGAVGWRVAMIGVLILCGALEVDLVALGMRPYVVREPVAVPVLVWLATICTIVWGVFYDARVRRWIGGTTPIVLRTIGLMTYPLYLLHDVVGSAVLRSSGVVGRVAALVAAIGVALALSYVAVRMEPVLRRPLRRVLDRLAGVAWRVTAVAFGRRVDARDAGATVIAPLP